MNDAQVKALALSLMKANSEEEVIGILKTSGYWDDPKLWRFYGDYENNYNAIGNQQGRPDAALVEKFVNSIDARLMNECLERGIDPEGPNAPLTIREAVARFFETEVRPDSPQAGQVKNWATDRRTEVGRGLTLVATGAGAKSGNPCFTISDCGEGQTPEKMPETILSLTRSNKLRIPFVQGKFNMGGTGVFEFCGPNGLQFVLTRRHPKILRGKLADPSDGKWGGDRCAAGERRGRASEFCLHLSRPSRRGYCPGQGPCAPVRRGLDADLPDRPEEPVRSRVTLGNAHQSLRVRGHGFQIEHHHVAAEPPEPHGFPLAGRGASHPALRVPPDLQGARGKLRDHSHRPGRSARRRPQIPKFLEAMDSAGFDEVSPESIGLPVNDRLWRSAPGRRWFALIQGTLATSREVVLFHRPKRD